MTKVDGETLYWRLHSLSKSMEGRGHIDEDELPDAYPALLDAMAFVRGGPAPAAPQQGELSGDDLSVEFKRGWDAALAAAPQQAEPVAWAVFDPSGEAIYAALFKTRCVEHRDNEYRYGHGTAKHWAVRPVFAHPPADEVQRLRDAARDVCEWADAAQWALGNETGVPAAKLDALRRALEGGE